jgi:hypothetical protein
MEQKRLILPTKSLSLKLTLLFLLLWQAVTIAQEKSGGYVPPPGKDRRQSVISGGSRGCLKQTDVSLTLLVPSHHTPTTISEHPTLLLHIDNLPAQPLLFTLVEPDVSQPLLEKKLTVKQPGIIQIKLPPESPTLKVNKEYYWTVAVVCNEKRPSENAYARAVIKRIPLTTDLRQKLDAATNPLAKAQIYAQSGIWYDAIATSYQVYTQNPNTAYFWQLIEQIGLNKIRLVEELANHR